MPRKRGGAANNIAVAALIATTGASKSLVDQAAARAATP
jgi:hypothetical protein